MKNAIRPLRRHAIAAAIAAAFGAHAGSALAQLPGGATVVNGSAGIVTNGGQMTITNSPNAVLNWQSFSIGAQNRVRFEQPSASSQVLNRVVGNDPSNILGSLSSNGGVWLVNPHGVLFGSNARIDVGGLVASSLPIANDDFLAGRFRFGGPGQAGGQVLNQGEIGTSFGGHVWLVGNSVRNEGLVRSPGGSIVLAAGNSVELVDSGLPNVAVRVTAPDNGAVNLGTLLAPSGGSIDIHGGIVNQQGIVRADSIGTDPAGRVVIRAEGDVRLGASSETGARTVVIESGGGDTVVQGRVDATNPEGGGGRIHLLGRNVGVTGHAVVDASGAGGGGEVLVGGDYQGANPLIRNAAATYLGADATVRASATGDGDGDGGKVILWGDQVTRVFGTIEARGGPGGGNGGMVETSGHVLDARPARLDVGAAHGKGGTWLLDPGNITITDCCSQEGGLSDDDTADFSRTSFTDDAYIEAGVITSQIQQGTNVIIKTGGGDNTTQAGDIVVAHGVVISESGAGQGTLTLQAHNDIVVNAGVKISLPSSSVTLTADADDNGTGSIMLRQGAQVSTGERATLKAATSGAAPNGTILMEKDSALNAHWADLTTTGLEMQSGSKVDSPHITVTASGDVTLTKASLNFASTLNQWDTDISVTGKKVTLDGAAVTLSIIEPDNAVTSKITINATTLDVKNSSTIAVSSSGPISATSNVKIAADTVTLANSSVKSAATGFDYPESPATAEGDIDITANTLKYTSSVLSAPDGRWLIHLGPGQTAFPDLGNLNYSFIQVDADEDAIPVVSGIGWNGIMMADPLAVRIKVNATRPYDGTREATFDDALSVTAPSGFAVNARNFNGTRTGLFQDRNVGTDKPITYSAGGSAFDLYTTAGVWVSGATQTYVGDITPRPITAAGLVAANKVYDYSRDATVSGRLSGILGDDDVTLIGATGEFDTKNVGTGKTVTITGGTLGGTDATNYMLTGGATTTADITPRPITAAGLVAADKVYDRSRDATVSGTLSGILGDDVVTLDGATGQFDTKNVGTNKTVTIAGGTLAGTDAGNYMLTGGTTTTATITPRPITAAGLVAADKVYDRSRDATVSGTPSGVLGDDDVTLAGATGQFDTKNAGTNKTVTISGGTLAGTDAPNYLLTDGATTTASITPRPVTAAGVQAADKVYDGTRAATVTGSLSGILEGDAVTLDGATGQFDTKNAGTNKTVTIAGGTLAGTDAGNYTLTAGATTTASITPRPVTAAGLTAADKVYDGTRDATVSGNLSGILGDDAVTLDGVTGQFDTKNAGTNKTVTISGGTLAGADAANYTLGGGATTTTASITPRPLTAAGILAADKVYDGTTAATLSGGFTGALPGDVLTLGTTAGTFDTKNAGTNKTVTFGAGVLAGTDAGNYQLTGPLATTAAITQRPITAAGIQAADKVYDGNTVATLSGGFTGAIPGDVLTLGTTAGEFDTKNAGTNKTVTFGAGVLAGADAGNYRLTGPLATTAAITPRPLTIAIAGPVSKEYDATTNATLGANQFALNNAVAGDTLTVSGPAQGSYATPDAGENKAVSATGTFQVGGADAPNYRIGTVNLTSGTNAVDATASGTGGSISPATLTYVADPAVREPGLPTAGLGGTVTGFKGSDTLASATTGALAWESAASPTSLPGTYAILGAGLSANNYRFVQAAGNATALTMRFDMSPAKPQARAQETSTQAVASAMRGALPTLDPRGSGGGVFDRSNPAAARTFGAVPIGAMNQDELAAMLAQRREFKRKLFADAIYKLEIDPSLADVQPCPTVADASTGACRITAAQLELIHASRAQVAAATKTAVAKTAHVPQIERKVVVLFGINDYADKTIPQLENAVPDVDAVAKIFAEKLGYEVRVVRNPDKAAIIRTLNGLAAEMNSQDSVVVYYAGHGYSLEKNGAGYWIPADAKAVDPHGWISNNDIAKLLGGIRAKQMALISDSCYSGAFAREGMDAVGQGVTVDDVLTKRSVVVLSSGGDEPVADEGKDGHSIFAWNLMRVVGGVQDWKPGSTIFTDVQSGVKKEFPQTPKYGAVTAAGHQRGGDYLFELR